jgi:hypothetical protein
MAENGKVTTLLCGGINKRKKEVFIESVENNAEILDEKINENRRINASIITPR